MGQSVFEHMFCSSVTFTETPTHTREHTPPVKRTYTHSGHTPLNTHWLKHTLRVTHTQMDASKQRLVRVNQLVYIYPALQRQDSLSLHIKYKCLVLHISWSGITEKLLLYTQGVVYRYSIMLCLTVCSKGNFVSQLRSPLIGRDIYKSFYRIGKKNCHDTHWTFDIWQH